MKRLSGVVAAVTLGLGATSVTAGSIRCQGEVLYDDQLQPVTKAQVREKCGKPEAEDFGRWTYRTEANVTKVLRFNDAGELETITEEVGE